jgi:glyoxylate/hydroxypyruvate reductase A
MKIQIADPFAAEPAFLAELAGQAPDLDIAVWPGAVDGDADVLLAWEIPADFPPLPPDLRAVVSFGAGTDRLERDPRIPAGTPIFRLEDGEQAERMADYVLAAAWSQLVGLPQAARNEDRRHWSLSTDQRLSPDQFVVTLLGAGFIGTCVARRLADAGFAVRCWSRNAKQIEGVESHHGPGAIEAAVAGAHLLVNILPLNEDTRGILSAALLRGLHPGAGLVNIGRGEHLDEQGLQGALIEGAVGHAWLDAFPIEPLPADHWMWGHDRISVTPHISGPPSLKGAAASLMKVLQRIA